MYHYYLVYQMFLMNRFVHYFHLFQKNLQPHWYLMFQMFQLLMFQKNLLDQMFHLYLKYHLFLKNLNFLMLQLFQNMLHMSLHHYLKKWQHMNLYFVLYFRD